MLRQKFLLTYGIQFISLLFGITSSIIVARIGGPNVLGTLAFGMAFVAVFQFVTDLGIGTAQQKLVTSTEDIADYITTFAILKISTSFVFLVVIVAYYYIQVHFFNNHDIAKPEIKTVIFIYIAINFIDSLSYIFRTNFIARTERAKVDIPTFIQSTLDRISRIVLVAIGFGAIALATSSLIYTVLVLPVNYLLFKNYRFGKFRKDLLKKYVSISLPVIVIMFAQQWTDNIDRILLRELHGTYELGLYMAAFSLSLPVRILGSSVSSILFPSFSTYLFKKKFSEIAVLMTRYRKYLIAILLPFVILMILFSSQVVLLFFGEKYRATISYFPFIILTLFVYIFTLPSLNLAFANGIFKKIAVISIFILSFQSVVIYLLSSKAGMNLKGLGAAIALLVTNILLLLIYGRIANKIITAETDKTLMLFMFFQVVLSIAAWFALKSGMRFRFIFVPISYLAIVFIAEWKAKIITREDIQFFLSFFNLKPLMQYVKNEMNER